MSLVPAVLLAFIVSICLTPLVRSLARRRGWLAHPRDDRWHRDPVALFGGAAIVVAFLVGVAASGSLRPLAPVLACVLLMAALGFADDVFRLTATTKLVGQMIVAAVLIAVTPPLHVTTRTTLDTLLAFVWIVGITNAFNLLDNMDGLSAGVAVIAGVCDIIVLATGGFSAILPAVAAFVGAVAGFLVFNVQPASIFMGDGGSLFIGSFLAALSLVAAPGLTPRLAPVALVPVLILMIPIFDTVFVSVTRSLEGRSAFVGGRDHTSHRLVALGLNERLTVVVLWALAALGGLVAIAMQRMPFAYAVIVLGLCLIMIASLAVVIGHVPPGRGARQEFAPLLLELTHRYRIYEVVLDFALIAIAYYAAFRIRFQEPAFGHFLPFFARSIPIVVGCQLAGLWAVGKYRQVWPAFSAAELLQILKGLVLGVAASVLSMLYLYRFEGFSRAVFLADGVILSFLLVGSRVVLTLADQTLRHQRASGDHVIIYGAGQGGLLLLRELLQNRELALAPVGFVDDDPTKQRLRLEGLPVLGRTQDLERVLARTAPRAVLISVRDLPADRMRELAGICARHGVAVRRMRMVLEDLQPAPRSSEVV